MKKRNSGLEIATQLSTSVLTDKLQYFGRVAVTEAIFEDTKKSVVTES